MYDSDYEYDVLGVLRLLRFVQMYRPQRAAHLVSGETAFSVEEILEFLYYSMEEIFDDCYSDYVNIEKKGKSYIIKPSERPELDKAYLNMLAKLKLQAAAPCGVQSLLTPRRAPGGNEKPTVPQPEKPAEKPRQSAPSQHQLETEKEKEPGGKVVDLAQYRKAPETPAWEYIVTDVKVQKGMNGEYTNLMLQNPEGKKCLAFTRGSHPELCRDARLFHVRKTLKQQDSVTFYYLESFEILEEAA